MSRLAEVLAAAPHAFVDFDGPICAVFGGKTTDRVVANLLRHVLGDRADELPPAIASSPDPFDVLRFAANLGPHKAADVERRLARLEINAVTHVRPTDGAAEAMTELHRAGRTMTIVSNNSAAAVAAFLADHDLLALVAGISARTSDNPEKLKPHPHLLNEAIRARHAPPAACVLIGDSVTDVQAAQAAGTLSIGYANKPGKLDRLIRAGADAIVTTMAEIADAARSLPMRTG